MPWNIVLSLLLIWIYLLSSNRVAEGKTIDVYWNSTNPIFYTSGRANEIDINLGDSIDIICPQYPVGTSITDMEYYVIYMVNETEYNTCIINNTSKFKMLVNCSYPTYNPAVFYTLLIKQFQSIPGNPDFQPGVKYYFITTSGGSYHEVDNQYLGACHDANMRLTLNVCCENNSTPKPPFGGNNTPHPPKPTTPRPQHTTRRPTTTQKTTTTTTTTTTTPMRRTTPRTIKPTNTDSIPGNGNLPDENVIHANGPKNVGLISDNGGHRTLLSVVLLLVSVSLTLLFR